MIGRIRERRSFDRIRREGVRVRVDPLWCSHVPDSHTTLVQVAFAIGRATGNAVTRNRLRRRLRAILAGCELPGGLLLVGATPAATELTFAELQQACRELITELTTELTTRLPTRVPTRLTATPQTDLGARLPTELGEGAGR